MTIRNKIYTAGGVVFALLVILASMNIAMHMKVRHDLEVRDRVSQKLSGIEEYGKWANNLNLLVSDIVASGHVPDFAETALEPPFGIGEEDSRELLDHASTLIDLVNKKEEKTEEAENRFETLRITINDLYYKLDKKISTVLAVAQIDRVLGQEPAEEDSLAPYVLKSLNQLTLVAMDNLLRRHHPQSAKDAVDKNRRFLTAQLPTIDKDGSMTSLFDLLLAEIDSMAFVFPEFEQAIGQLETRIKEAKNSFDETISASSIHAAIDETTLQVQNANQALESASRNTLIVSFLFLIGAPILVIATGLLGLNQLIVRPITNLVKAMKEFEKGDFDAEAPVRAPDEVGKLAQAFNTMASQIKTKVNDLALLNQSLEEREEQLKAVLESNANPIMIRDSEGSPEYVNPAFTEVFGWNLDSLADEQTQYVPEDQVELTTNKFDEAYTTARPVKFQSRRLTNAGRTLDVIIAAALIKGPDSQGRGMVENLTDVSEQINLETQLRQVQKMEAIGQLAGGVAHDFNNILTAIFGNVDLAISKLKSQFPEANATLDRLQQIKEAARRAASLTRQLLAFSRRQVIRPEAVNINDTLYDLERMLHRLITEDIDLELRCEPNLDRVKVDPGQLEQVIVNLVVNARDAMKDGGQLTLETQNVILDQDYVVTHGEVVAGPNVLLTVSDTGSGMDQATLERVFEPFFTTKPTGQGTGLGLATVYGIIKQSGGNITIYSEPGLGTTFKVYFPAVQEPATPRERVQSEGPPPRGNETILICEDDNAVRELTKQTLKEAGYTVITAEEGQKALQLAGETTGRIDLLITDVIMPEMNGKKLSDTLTKSRPEIRTLFVSGYTSNVIAHHGVLEENVEFLEKPYSRQQLLERIREVLDRPTYALKAAGTTELEEHP